MSNKPSRSHFLNDDNISSEGLSVAAAAAAAAIAAVGGSMGGNLSSYLHLLDDTIK